MSDSQIKTIDEATKGFEIGDIFLSRTDERGIIKFGNDTFVRVSGFGPEQFLGAPHKVVRHPDMPKTAFRMFWESLQAGKPFCAYVKNKDAQGRYYWVFAVAAPIEDGYLSVRLKPSTPLFDAVRDLYAKVRAGERDENASPEIGKDTIIAAVKEMGFRDYDAFMGYALATELTARATAQGQIPDQSIVQFEEIGRLLTELTAEVAEIEDLFEGIRTSPINLSVLGAKLTKGREPMKVVASNYTMLMDDLVLTIKKLSGALEELLKMTFAGRVKHCASILYAEAITNFRLHEAAAGSASQLQELAILDAALRRLEADAGEDCRQIEQDTAAFVRIGEHLRRLMTGLAVTRVTCQIEAASIVEYVDNIADIATKLEAFQDALEPSLDRVISHCVNVQKNLPRQTVSSQFAAA